MKDFEGFELGEVRTIREMINHLLFVDDLKLYTKTLLQIGKLLDFATTFTNDIGIFGESKCTFVCIVRGKRKSREFSRDEWTHGTRTERRGTV